MNWIDKLHEKIVGLDTAPLIYYIERHPKFSPALGSFFQAAGRREFQIVTSFVTLLEVLVLPFRSGREERVAQYREILLHSDCLTVLPVNREVAEQAARLRAAHAIKTPDAIQLATAWSAGAAAFLTNDPTLPSAGETSTLLLDSLVAPS